MVRREGDDDIAKSPYVLAQRKRFQNMFGAAQRPGGPKRGEQPPVQRLIGFEVEYQVPTFGPARQVVTLWDDENSADADLNHFLFGGLAYGTKLGGSANPGDNSFRITSDHKRAVSRNPIRAKLAGMGLIDPGDAKDEDHHSNLEYVTSPVDELAKGADKILGPMIDSVANHATTTFGLAKKDTAGRLTAPAAGVATGTPVDKIKNWLTGDNFKLLKPTIEQFQANILDSCYLQATVGILPSTIDILFSKAKEGGLHDTGGQYTQIYDAVTTSSRAVAKAVKGHEYIKDLLSSEENEVLASVSGMIELLAMYLVGEALSQTAAFPGGSIKNAVPFLVKIDPAKIANTGPYGMVFDDVPDDFVTVLADELGKREEFKAAYWRGLGYGSRNRKLKDFVTLGSIKDLTSMFLQGKKPLGTQAQTGGSSIDDPDAMKETKYSTKGQKGIPLEYRYVSAHPTAAGLKAELLKLVAEAREINLSRVPEETKSAIEKQVKE